MGAPGPRFPAKLIGFLALYAPFRIERRTRGPVQHYVQEIRGVSLLRPGILHANAGWTRVLTHTLKPRWNERPDLPQGPEGRLPNIAQPGRAGS